MVTGGEIVDELMSDDGGIYAHGTSPRVEATVGHCEGLTRGRWATAPCLLVMPASHACASLLIATYRAPTANDRHLPSFPQQFAHLISERPKKRCECGS